LSIRRSNTGQSTPTPTTQLRSLFRADQLNAFAFGGWLGSKQFGPLAALHGLTPICL